MSNSCKYFVNDCSVLCVAAIRPFKLLVVKLNNEHIRGSFIAAWNTCSGQPGIQIACTKVTK